MVHSVVFSHNEKSVDQKHEVDSNNILLHEASLSLSPFNQLLNRLTTLHYHKRVYNPNNYRFPSSSTTIEYLIEPVLYFKHTSIL